MLTHLLKAAVCHQSHYRERKGIKDFSLRNHGIAALTAKKFVYGNTHIQVGISDYNNIMRVMGDGACYGSLMNIIAVANRYRHLAAALMPFDCGNLPVIRVFYRFKVCSPSERNLESFCSNLPFHNTDNIAVLLKDGKMKILFFKGAIMQGFFQFFRTTRNKDFLFFFQGFSLEKNFFYYDFFRIGEKNKIGLFSGTDCSKMM